MNIFDLPRDEFLGYLPELRQQGLTDADIDNLVRQYRQQNSPLAGINEAATASQGAIADAGRSTVAGGLLSKPEGATGMDAVRGLQFEGMNGLLGALSGAGQAVDAPMAAAQGLIPQGDMALEALGTAGAAMTGGGAATTPRGSLRAGLARNATETKPQRIARLLREGRQSEVTDGLLGSLTPDENAALSRLYDEGATGMDLPMDAASRLARAEAQDFDTQNLLYHGSDTPEIKAFDPSRGAEGLPATFLTDSRRVASTYGDNVGEYFSRADYPAEFDFNGRSATSFDNQSLTPGGLVRRVREAADDARIYGAETDTDLAFDLQSANIDPMYADEINAVRMRDVVDDFGFGGNPANNLAVFDPSNIRSRDARFDPRLSGNANLLAANADTSGGLLATAASDALTPSQQMARRILDMRAAGRARDVTDDMMARADPQYMFNNTPLPMDAASRAARAQAAGFGDDMYHGSTHSFDNFGGGRTRNTEGHFGAGDYLTSSADDASMNYAGEGPDLTQRITMRAEQLADEMGVDYDDPAALAAARNELSGGTDGLVYPVRYRANKEFDISDDGDTFLSHDQPQMDPADYLDEAGGDMDLAQELAMDDSYNFEPEGDLVNFMDSIRRDGRVFDNEGLLSALQENAYDGGLLGRQVDDVMRNTEWWAEDDMGGLVNNEVYRNSLQDAGFDAIRHNGDIFAGMDIEPGTTHTIINNPTNIRSQFARFDPEFAHLSNLSAANASPTAGLLAMPAQQEKETELPFMNFLKGLLQ